MTLIFLVLAAGEATRCPAVLTSLRTNGFVQQVAETHASLVKLGFRVPDRATHDFRDLVVLETLYVVKHEHRLVSRRQLLDRSLKVHTIDRTAQPHVGAAEIPSRSSGLFVGLGHLFERSLLARLLSKLHEHNVHSQAMEPGRKCRFTAECGDLAEQLEESLLRQVLRLGNIPHHPKAQRIDTATM